MVTVNVRFFGNWRDVTREKQLCLTLSRESNLLDLLELLTERYGESFKVERLLNLDGQFICHFLIGVNGELLQSPKRLLKDGDAILFLFPVVGG